ncbi:MAG: 16S rRNA (cytosine(1402)-N(4))-methyltransferase RsmH [Planctomycetota bacterium]|nr:16S rRNA (cytosine(1402)-N(4))-methyltransferase RsmH [Planctomycetota bacterium]
MPAEVVEALAVRPGDTVVDGTAGLGGHAHLLGSLIGKGGRLLCFDRDPQTLELARARLSGLACRVDFINLPFEFMDREFRRLGLSGADRIVLDLGVSSVQLDSPERGFSFQRNGPLDMRMNPAGELTAGGIVNTWSKERLSRLFLKFGEEPFSRRLAKSIVEARAIRPIETTGELAELAIKSIPVRGRIHPATRMFQAIRICVNDELGCLSRGLAAAGRTLAPKGRMAVISFHSLEDRLVKRTFMRWREMGLAKWALPGGLPPGREEVRLNPRSRSAKLRAVERL